MKGDPEIIEALNEVLTSELTAINQYFVHSKMCKNWGFEKLAKKMWDESIEEMKHADEVIDRILYLDGVPNMQRLFPVRVGETVKEMHELDLQLEVEAAERYNRFIKLAGEKNDNGTRDLLEKKLVEEEEAIDWTEAQLGIIETIGIENYLAEQIHA
ncbi:MAG: bacterioferritin [Planctomycetota bacterium]